MRRLAAVLRARGLAFFLLLFLSCCVVRRVVRVCVYVAMECVHGLKSRMLRALSPPPQSSRSSRPPYVLLSGLELSPASPSPLPSSSVAVCSLTAVVLLSSPFFLSQTLFCPPPPPPPPAWPPALLPAPPRSPAGRRLCLRPRCGGRRPPDVGCRQCTHRTRRRKGDKRPAPRAETARMTRAPEQVECAGFESPLRNWGAPRRHVDSGRRAGVRMIMS
jgi:hypothetical protein